MSGLPEIVLLIATEHESLQSGPTGPHRECLAQVQVLSATFAHPKKPDQPRGPHPRGRQKSADRAELSILPKKMYAMGDLEKHCKRQIKRIYFVRGRSATQFDWFGFNQANQVNLL